MKEMHHPEIHFLKNQLPGFVIRNPALFLRMAGSVVAGRQRNMAEDFPKLATLFKEPAINGKENIPTVKSPVIIACNHPYINDMIYGIVFITKIVSEERKKAGMSGNIHWFMTGNVPRRNSNGKVKEIILFPTLDWIVPRFIKTYQFIGVPTHDKANYEKQIESLDAACEYLKEEDGSRIIGLFPEGDIEFNGELRNFLNGIGRIAESVKDLNPLILPTGIYRNNQSLLAIDFGEPIEASKIESSHKITKATRLSIENLLQLK